MATTLIHDTFTEASPPVDLDAHTPEDGGSWTSETSIWGTSGPSYEHIVNDRAMTGEGTLQVALADSGSVTVASYHSQDPLAADLEIYWDIGVWFGKFADYECGIVWRAKLAQKDGYALEYDGLGGPNDSLRLVRYDNGSKTELWNSQVWYPNDTLQSFKITVLGDEITVYHWEDPGGGDQWVQKTQQTDSTYTTGKFLLLDWGSQGSSHNAIVVDAADTPPVKPTISLDDQGPDFVDYTSSAFQTGVPNSAHYASQWQVTLAADTGFATPVIDTTSYNVASFEAFHAAPLNLFQNQYIARVRHQDVLLRWTDWSDASTASSLESSGQFYTAFAERPIGINLRTDIPADWSELDISDGESSWFFEERDDATCLVTADRVALSGDADTVDPILWEGFPSVASQIVFGRFIFDTIQADQEACASGVADSTGIICRETYGLEHGPIYGAAGSGGINPAGTTQPLADIHGGLVTGLCAHDNPDVYDPGIAALSTEWVQIAWYRYGGTPYAERHYPYLSVDPQHIAQGHLCGAIYGTYGWLLTQNLGVVSPNVIASPPPDFWNHNKFGNGPDGRATRHLAWESHLGHPNETRKGTAAMGSGDITFGLKEDCSYGCTEGLPWDWPKESDWYFDELIVCAGNTVTILDLPLGWKVQIGGTGPHVSCGSAFWPQPIYGDASNDQEIDFDSFAFPADTMYVWFAGNDDPNNPDITWDVPTGIWGGDVYRIKPTVVGAAGVGARLSGTFEGTDGTGYIAYLDATGGLKLDKWSAAGGLVNLDSDPFVMLPGRYYNVVLEATGTTIRAKAWEGGAGLQGDPENNDPLTWAISVTDATYASGAPGLVGLTQQPVDFDAFAAGLGGDPYPTGRYPGASTWVNPVSGVVLDTGDSPLLLEWTAAPVTAGVLGGELSYELEYQIAGDPSWSPLATNIRALTYSWDLSSLPQGTYCVQVRAYAGCEVGPWANTCFTWQGGIAKSPEGYFFGDWYTGEADVGMWIRLFQASHLDDLLPVNGCLVTRELMPAGVNGECLFQKLYVTVTTTTTGVLAVTPILDGRYLIEERRFVSLDNLIVDGAGDPIGTTGRKTRRYEIDLTRGYGSEEFRYGYRGSYWQVEICATDYTGQGRIELDGVALRYTVVRETHPWARPFVGELEVDVELERKRRFFFGTTTEDSEAAIWLAEEGGTDFGERLRALIEPNPHAPFGPSEEAWFRNLYLSFTRANNSEVTLLVTPILDGVNLETQTITLPAVVGTRPLTDIHELPLSVALLDGTTEVGRYGARGVWFSFRITNSSQRGTGEFALNGAAVEVIPVRESEPGVT